jgi:hypothetical protein
MRSIPDHSNDQCTRSSEIFLMMISESLSGLDLRPDGAMNLHQRGVITLVLLRRSGAINTGYVHWPLIYRILHTIT